MKLIWKYTVPQKGANMVQMPDGARIKHFAVFDGVPSIWAEVDPMERPVLRRVHVAWTGEDFDREERMTYIGTAIESNGLVLHAYADAVGHPIEGPGVRS